MQDLPSYEDRLNPSKVSAQLESCPNDGVDESEAQEPILNTYMKALKNMHNQEVQAITCNED